MSQKKSIEQKNSSNEPKIVQMRKIIVQWGKHSSNEQKKFKWAKK